MIYENADLFDDIKLFKPLDKDFITHFQSKRADFTKINYQTMVKYPRKSRMMFTTAHNAETNVLNNRVGSKMNCRLFKPDFQ